MHQSRYGKNEGFSPEAVAPIAGLTVEQVVLAYKDIDNKRKSTRYLHLPPVLIEKVQEIG